MTFRIGALLCLSGLAACSQNTNEPAKDATYVEPASVAVSDPPRKPAALDADQQAPSPTVANNDTRAPLLADTNGTRSDASRVTPPAPATPAPAADAPPANQAAPGVAPDNTKVNKRDTKSTALTPMDQNNNQTDLKITQQIRQAVMADKSLSFTAKNVKIITQNGKVTLRGPVNTAQERDAIEAAARRVTGAVEVDDQLEVKK